MYYLIPLTRFKSFQTKDEKTARDFAKLFNLSVTPSSTPAKSLVVISLDAPSIEPEKVMPFSQLYDNSQPLGIGA